MCPVVVRHAPACDLLWLHRLLSSELTRDLDVRVIHALAPHSPRERPRCDIDSLFASVCWIWARQKSTAADSDTSEARLFQMRSGRTQHYLTPAISFIHPVRIAPSAPRSAICCMFRAGINHTHTGQIITVFFLCFQKMKVVSYSVLKPTLRRPGEKQQHRIIQKTQRIEFSLWWGSLFWIIDLNMSVTL